MWEAFVGGGGKRGERNVNVSLGSWRILGRKVDWKPTAYICVSRVRQPLSSSRESFLSRLPFSLLFAEGAFPVWPSSVDARTPQVHDRPDVAHLAQMSFSQHLHRVPAGLAQGLARAVRLRKRQEGGRAAVVGGQPAFLRLRNDSWEFQCFGEFSEIISTT